MSPRVYTRLAVYAAVVVICGAFIGQWYSSARAGSATQVERSASQRDWRAERFVFESGTQFGTIDSSGDFFPYTKGEVGRLVKEQLQDESCDDPARIEECFIRAVNERYAAVTSTFQEMVATGSLVKILGYDLAERHVRFELDTANVPELVVHSSLRLLALAGAVTDYSERLKVDEDTLSLDNVRFVYGSNTVRATGPFLSSHSARAQAGATLVSVARAVGPNILTAEYYEAGTRRMVVNLSDADGNGTLDEVTFAHPYEAIPRYDPERKKRECAIYGTGLFTRAIRAHIENAETELIGLPTPPTANVQVPAVTLGIDNKRFDGDRSTVDLYFKVLTDLFRDVDRKLAARR